MKNHKFFVSSFGVHVWRAENIITWNSMGDVEHLMLRLLRTLLSRFQLFLIGTSPSFLVVEIGLE